MTRGCGQPPTWANTHRIRGSKTYIQNVEARCERIANAWTGVMGTFSFLSFQRALSPLIPLRAEEIAGRPRALGGCRGVGVDLLMASHNADMIHSAAMQLAYAEGTADFDTFSRDCLRAFLTAVLGDPAMADAWSDNAFRQLAAEGVQSCSTTHEGFVLTLQQQKPYQMFLVTACDDSAED